MEMFSKRRGQLLYFSTIVFSIYKQMKKNIIFISFLLFLFFACSDKSQKVNNESPILLKVGQKADKTQLFKEYFELETIIPIETTDEFLMGDGIRRVLSYKDKLIILDWRSAIFVVDYATGKIDTYIHRIGVGPGESKLIKDISFDEHSETILAFNDYQNLLFFNIRGNFIKQEKLNKSYDNIVFDNGNVLFYNEGEGYSCYPYFIDKYNLQNKSWEKIGRNDRLDFPMRLYGRHLVKSKSIWIGTPFDFDLYKYNNSKMESIYKLDPALPRITKEEMILATTDPRKFSDVRETSMYGIGAIRETEHYLIFISSGRGFFIMNKETNEIHWENFLNETSLGLMLLNYFSHDGDDNRIMFFVRPSEWLRRNKDANMDNLPAALREKINSFKIDEEDNPILIFYREK